MAKANRTTYNAYYTSWLPPVPYANVQCVCGRGWFLVTAKQFFFLFAAHISSASLFFVACVKMLRTRRCVNAHKYAAKKGTKGIVYSKIHLSDFMAPFK